MQIVASVATYAELRDALRERRLELGLTQLALDHCAGLQDGWSSKAEMSDGKRWGEMSLNAALGALGLKLLVVADDGSLPAVTRANLYTSKCKQAATRPLVTLPPVAPPMIEANTPAPAAEPAPQPALALLEAA
ncbi:MAG: hypothetical protein WA733_10560 [Methylocystis sp.]